jgi:hypothetical protein
MNEPGAQGLLAELRQSGHGTNTLAAAVYNELRQLAHHYLREEHNGHTLQATALVPEAFLRLIPQQHANREDRGRFIGIAAHPMRQVLVDYARGRQRDERGGKDQERAPLRRELTGGLAANLQTAAQWVMTLFWRQYRCFG